MSFSFWKHINEDLLPNALMIGVNYELFWTLDPNTLAPFIRAFELKQEYDDRVSWNNGVYVRLAIVSAMNKNQKYPTKPFTYEERAKTPEEQQAIIKRRFMDHATMLNSRLEKRDSVG